MTCNICFEDKEIISIHGNHCFCCNDCLQKHKEREYKIDKSVFRCPFCRSEQYFSENEKNKFKNNVEPLPIAEAQLAPFGFTRSQLMLMREHNMIPVSFPRQRQRQTTIREWINNARLWVRVNE